MRKAFVLAILAAILGVAALLHRGAGWPPALALAAAVLLELGVHILILGTGFALSRRVASPIPPERARRGDLVRAFWGELKVSIWAFYWAMPFRAGFAAPRPAVATATPVLLLHGYLCNRGLWRPLMRWLAARGHPVEAIDLLPLFAGLEHYGPRVAEAVDALCRRSGAPQAILVCHSMGGLVARQYLQAHGAGRVLRVVTLGTPHHGTHHARLGLGANARQMRHGGPWLGDFAASEDAALRERFVTFMSYHDNIVAPQESAVLPGARVERFTGLGHMQLATEPRVWKRLERYL